MHGRLGKLLCFLLVFAALPGCDETPDPSTLSKPKPSVPGPEDPDAPEAFTTTESGLKYRIRRKSDGPKPTPDKMVLVNYRGWLDDGTIFDTTYGTGGSPITMELKGGVAGWKEGLQLIGEGGMIELEVPFELGYGALGVTPTIPPKATLHFLVELIKVSDPPEPPSHPPHGPEGGPGEPGGGLQPGSVDPDAPEEFTTTESGLKYRIRRKSDGKKPTAANSVKVHYRGWLDDGRGFDSSYTRNDPATFGLGGVIAGWTEGLQLIGVGGMIELEVPSDLGYGDAGRPPQIPPKATLHFLVELLEVR